MVVTLTAPAVFFAGAGFFMNYTYSSASGA